MNGNSKWNEFDEISMKIDIKCYEIDEKLKNKNISEERYDQLKYKRKGLREAWRIIQENRKYENK